MPVTKQSHSETESPHSSSINSRDYRPRPGLSVPSVTVLDREGRIVEAEQQRVFRFNVQQGYGADILFGCGTTGEWNRLTNKQRQQLMRIEVGEARRLNEQLARSGVSGIEAWVGVTAATQAELLANLDYALEIQADAAVVAPLSTADIGDVVRFFQGPVMDLFDRQGRSLPVFLYDNADIAVNPLVPHLRTADVKRLSRLPFIAGIKVSAPRRVLGHYTKAALHFKDKGEFGIYIGDAMLIFDVYKLETGVLGKLREYWNRYLLHHELPIGVISGPANVLPREWQRAWRACYSGDDHLSATYREIFNDFDQSFRFEQGGKIAAKAIACLKYALKLEGVIDHDNVAGQTSALTDEERRLFHDRFARIKEKIASTNSVWRSRL